MNSKIVLLSGTAESGKTTVANMLKERLEEDGKKCLIINFSDYLKFIAKAYFGWDGVKDDAGRQILQHLGTDIVRKRSPKFWINTVLNFIRVFHTDFDYFLVADVRFANERYSLIEAKMDVLSINVVRLEFKNSLTDEQRNHPSEHAPVGFFDYTLSSKSGLDNLSKEVDKLYDNFIESFW
jgi:hypothetical protein